MIRKPADDWGRESAAVETVRNVAAGGKAVVQTGGRIVRGGYLCLLGGVFLLGALASSLGGGGMPTLIGGGVIGALLLAAGLRAFKAPPAAVETAPFAPGAFVTGPSSAISYSRGKLLTQAAFAAGFMVLAAMGYGGTGGGLRFVLTLLIPLCGFMVFASVRKAFGDLTALRWDAQGVTVTGLLKSHTVAWSSVRSVDIVQINTYAYGFVKVASRRMLSIQRTDGPMFGKKLTLSLALLDLQGRPPEGVVLAMQATQLGRPSSAAAPAPTPRFDAPQPSHPRAPAPYAPTPYAPTPYADVAAPAAPRYSARPDVPPAPAAYGANTPRPTFGRRGA